MKPNFKRLLAALAIVGGFSVGGVSSAQATAYDLGTLTSNTTINQVINVDPGEFTDTFTFVVSDSSAFYGSVANLALVLNLVNVRDISHMELELGTDPVGVGATLSMANLAPGAYHLIVTGDAVGTAGGTYGLAVDVSAVPIPASVILFGSGLLALGLYGWRRNASLRPMSNGSMA